MQQTSSPVSSTSVQHPPRKTSSLSTLAESSSTSSHASLDYTTSSPLLLQRVGSSKSITRIEKPVLKSIDSPNLVK